MNCPKCNAVNDDGNKFCERCGQPLILQPYYCPQCGKENGLSTWNPIDGSCPKCNGKMEIDKSAGMTLAD